jgi:hypothetical protein
LSADSRIVAVQEPRQVLNTMTPAALLERREIVAEVIEKVMVENVHYGVIPGTRALSLLKEGAEVLLSTFHIAVEPTVTDQSTQTEVRFVVECRGIHMGSGQYVGSGIGVCSSNEEKYRWRKARSADEFEAAELTHRRLRYFENYSQPQVRQSPWDVFHTIMSMAKKRAMVDLAKTALAASEALKRVQQRKDENRGRGQPKDAGFPRQNSTPPANGTTAKTAGTTPSVDKAQDKSRPATSATPPAEKSAPALINADDALDLKGRIDMAGVPENAFLARFEIGRVEELEAARYEAAKSWIQANSA